MCKLQHLQEVIGSESHSLRQHTSNVTAFAPTWMNAVSGENLTVMSFRGRLAIPVGRSSAVIDVVTHPDQRGVAPVPHSISLVCVQVQVAAG